MRYNQLLVLVQAHKPKVIVEVGTWNGHRAIALATEALKHGPVRYIGFDLFEDATPENDAAELNVKKPCPVAEVQARLEVFKQANPGFEFQLVKGNTRKTLNQPWVKKTAIDIAFIDGGHSIETIKNDYEALKHARVVALDDYYSDGPDITKYGCNALVETLPDRVILPQGDPVAGGGVVRIAVVPSAAWPGQKSLVVKTKNCVSDKHIQANIKYATTLIENWLTPCEAHRHEAVIVSGGASWLKHIKQIKEMQKAGAYVFCVKSTHNELIKRKIIPWGCFLLDPRPHVAAIVEPHPEVRYFLASMCHPTTADKVIGKRVWGYHAHVGAGEMDVVKKELGQGMLVGGGSTAAIRGVSVLHTVGFRTVHLVGFDSCYPAQDSKVHGIKQDKPIFKVNVSGRDFWTDAELLAQGQDFDKLLEQGGDMRIVVHGDGMFRHIFDNKRKRLATFEDCYA